MMVAPEPSGSQCNRHNAKTIPTRHGGMLLPVRPSVVVCDDRVVAASPKSVRIVTLVVDWIGIVLAARFIRDMVESYPKSKNLEQRGIQAA